MASADPIEDRLAIRELLERYADAVIRHDAAAWGACWLEDGIWVMGVETRGRAAIVTAWEQAMAPFALAAFFVMPGEIRIEGATGRARSFTHETLLPKAGGIRRIVGRYDDELIRLDDGWRFAARRYSLLADESA